jgi:hypothetical protein
MRRLSLLLTGIALLAVAAFTLSPDPAQAGGTFIPVFGDECCACVVLPGTMWLCTPDLVAAVEEATGQTAMVSTVGAALQAVPNAGTGHTVRMEGCYAAGVARTTLLAKGYVNGVQVEPLEGSPGAIEYSD